MQPILFLFYFIWLGLAAFCVFATTSRDPSRRQQLSALYMFVLLACILLSVLFLGKNGLFATIGLGLAWPFLFSIQINQYRPVPYIAFSLPLVNSLWLPLALTMTFPVFIYILVLPESIGEISKDGAILISEQFNFALAMLPIMLIFATRTFQKAIFCTDGIWDLDGMTPWADFQSYRWINVPGKIPYFELSLETKQYRRVKRKAYPLLPEDKARLEPILAQKFPKQ